MTKESMRKSKNLMRSPECHQRKFDSIVIVLVRGLDGSRSLSIMRWLESDPLSKESGWRVPVAKEVLVLKQKRILNSFIFQKN